MRAIERIDLEWDSGGRLRRKRNKRDEYYAYAPKEKKFVQRLARDIVTEYDYDNVGRLLTVSSGSSRSRFEYDARRRPVCIVPENSRYPPRRYAITYDADGRIASRESPKQTDLFHYDGQGRVSRRDVIRDSELVEYDTWEYGAHGAVTRQLIVKVEPASKSRKEIRQETERLYFYGEAGRLRETRLRGQLERTFVYTGKCNEVRNGPKSPSPIEEEGCLFSPYGVLQACE
jgi:YD repeat-containing protein